MKSREVILSEYQNALESVEFDVRGRDEISIKEQMEVFSSIDNALVPDVYGKGTVIESFENRMAKLFGKPSSVFFPSGTMAQQIAMRIYCDRKNLYKVAYHPLCHLEIHENDGLKKLHPIESVLLGEKNRLITIDDLKEMEDVSSVLLELPQREIGGELPSWEELCEIVKYLKDRDISVHLDGARIFECMPFYKKPYEEIGELFDSIYISFYKGLGGVTGAILLGEKDFLEEAKIWKRRYGGDLYHLYPYIITGEYAFDKREPMMLQFYEDAIEYAELLKTHIKSIDILPETPKTNMFHLFILKPYEEVIKVSTKIMKEYGIKLFGGLIESTHPLTGEKCIKSEISISEGYNNIPKEIIANALKSFNDYIDKWQFKYSR